MGRLDGRVAFVTGAARGQGRSHALRFAEEGADIVGIDLGGDVESVPYPLAGSGELEETKRQVEGLDRRMVAVNADVRSQEALDRAVDEGVAELGRIDIVLANAGILSTGETIDLSEQTWQDMIDINLTGVWHTCKATIPQLREQGDGGSIVITSSVAGLQGMPGIGHYVSAKHGVVGLMRTLANELAPDMIRVNSIHPTQVDTDMIQNEALYKVFLPDNDNPTRDEFAPASQETNALPIPWIESRDVSNAALFLSSQEGRYITGATLPVDAGVLVK